MSEHYRIIISSKNVYRELEISSDDIVIRFGTELNCDYRVRKSSFLEPVELIFRVDEENKWIVACSDNLYFAVDEIRKLLTIPIQHGSTFVVKYQSSTNEVMCIQFLMDFQNENKTYDRRFDINNQSAVTIGGSSSNKIVLNGKYACNELVCLKKASTGYLLEIVNSFYGVYHNGNLIDSQTEIRDRDFFTVANYSFYYKNGFLFTQKTNDISSNEISYRDSTERMQYPRFNRNSRVHILLDDEKIEILDPPAIPQKPKSNLLSRLLPSIVMIVVSIIMGLTGGMFILLSLMSAIAGVVTAILGVRDSKKEYKKAFEERIKKYNNYIDKKRIEINEARSEELSVLQDKYISEEQEISNLKKFSYTLFDRCVGDEDFLEIRLGLGKQEAKREIDYKKQERLEIEDNLQMYPQNLSEQYKYIDDAPVVCNFKEANAVGIYGEPCSRFQLMKNMLVDICARQYHSDVKLFFVAKEEHVQDIYWLRMLPHVYNDALGIHNIVCDDSSKTVIFEYLYKELTAREQNKVSAPHMIVFLYDDCEFKTHPISKYVDKGKELGITFVFFGDGRADMGLGCNYLIECAGTGVAKLMDTSDSKKETSFTYKQIADEDIKAMVQLLAPVYTQEVSLEGSLTKSITLFELLNIIAVDDMDLGRLWDNSRVYETMAAPIGVTKSSVVELDLHDKGHGPHGLVAGTTGAGKSEFLQTYILSMAMLYHPYEVGFVIIDFKGGGMANQFKDLPHMMGTITNIDGKEIDRSLRSIKAELKKRQRLFAEVDVNHIDKYIMKVRNGEASIPLPHLILIVDEFAELKADQPEFMKELISAARIGRSLGVHLILATQKPSGQVDEQIWSNSRFKLCLKVQSQQDSNEVLKSPLAAEIKEPGRAYLQVGNNEIFELFQSAYSGAPEHNEDAGMKEFTIYEITKSGRRKPVFQQKKKKGDGNGVTQLDAMVAYASEYCKKKQIEKLPNICLPSLSDMIPFPNTKDLLEKDKHIIADLGIYDDPDNQHQGMYSVDLSTQNMMLIGSAQSGKTNVLQTIIRSITSKYTPEEVNIYIIDFASMVLKNFEGLHHVGGVVTPSEDEKFKNLFKLLNSEIRMRKEKLLSAGVSSYIAYREAGHTDMPQIILMVDNLTLLNELYFQDEDLLLYICREGLSLGISVVVANSQTAGISYRYMTHFESKMTLHCIDPGEYMTILNAYKASVEDIKGRALVEVDGEILDAQMYVAFAGEREYEKNASIKQYVEETNQVFESEAKTIPEVPEQLSVSLLSNEFNSCTNKNQFSLGLNYDGVEPYVFDWIDQTVIGIVGKEKKNVLIDYMKNTFISNRFELYIVDDYTGVFEDIADDLSVNLYSRDLTDSEEILTDVHRELKKRSALRDTKGVRTIMDWKPVIVLIQNREWSTHISQNFQLSAMYKDCIEKYKGLKCCFIFTNMENERINEFQADEVIKPLIKKQQYVVFENIGDIKIYDVMHKEKQKFAGSLRAGEAFVLSNNVLSKIKVPMLD